ncbi:TPA: DNA helicase mcm9, variant 3 [Trebouxia sp. C0004]
MRRRVLIPISLDNAEASPPSSPCQVQSGRHICNNTKYRLAPSVLIHTNYQEIKIQENAKVLAVGNVPRSICVLLQDDLADMCQNGDDIEVTGIVTRQWVYSMPGARCNTDILLSANQLHKEQRQQLLTEVDPQAVQTFCKFWKTHADCPLAGRNAILASICPQLHGLCMIKLAMMLMLIGGEQRVSKTGGQVRAEVHMLLVGDPGTGKSQFMQYAAKLSPRAVMSSGRGSSSAGLTVTAIKDGGQWALEAGALVLADGGVCCIDEFDGIKEADKTSIHEDWDIDTIRQYLLWVKAAFHPELSAEAEEVLTGYYKLQRTAIDRTSARTTVRMLESLVRLAQAHAKLMARDVVTQQDAVVAVSMAEAASRILSGAQFTVGAAFCDDPDAAYDAESEHLLGAIRHMDSDSEFE